MHSGAPDCSEWCTTDLGWRHLTENVLSSAVPRAISGRCGRSSYRLSGQVQGGCRIGGMPFVVGVEGGHRDRLELRRIG
jgi:hypothetical protein